MYWNKVIFFQWILKWRNFPWNLHVWFSELFHEKNWFFYWDQGSADFLTSLFASSVDMLFKGECRIYINSNRFLNILRLKFIIVNFGCHSLFSKYFKVAFVAIYCNWMSINHCKWGYNELSTFSITNSWVSAEP